MRRTFWGFIVFTICTIFSVSVTASAFAADEVFVMSATLSGDPHYMAGSDEGIFSQQQDLIVTGSTGIDLQYKYSYGNGLGDFDNDGDLDYISAIGYGSGNIYIYEKRDSGNDFMSPEPVGTWGTEEGYFPMDMAVADFNEDGNADFVLSLGWSLATGLYLGDGKSPEGKFLFTSQLLPDSAAYSSAGADAADFNNDGHADFVIAPASSTEQFIVSLGDGKGNFTASGFDSVDGGVYGVAAADFTGDGNADIVAAYYDYIYIYEGGGDGTTFTYLDSYELPVNYSAIDNYDFDGDGNQDLVVADYAENSAGVTVLFGNGDGTFRYSDTYLGGSTDDRLAVTGPPYEANTNIEPVAVIEPTYLEVTAGQEITFDGSYSFDEDGEIVSYEWDFGEAEPITDGAQVSLMSMAAVAPVSTMSTAPDSRKIKEVNPSHTYFKTGSYTVTLVVTDDKGAQSSVKAEVDVQAVRAKVRFSPRKLKLKSRGNWMLATLKLPADFDSNQIDRSSIGVQVGDSDLKIMAQPGPRRGFLARLWRKIQRRMNIVTVRFHRQKIIQAIGSDSNQTDLLVTGKICCNDERVEFSGKDTITIQRPKPRKSKRWWSRWCWWRR